MWVAAGCFFSSSGEPVSPHAILSTCEGIEAKLGKSKLRCLGLDPGCWVSGEVRKFMMRSEACLDPNFCFCVCLCFGEKCFKGAPLSAAHVLVRENVVVSLRSLQMESHGWSVAALGQFQERGWVQWTCHLSLSQTPDSTTSCLMQALAALARLPPQGLFPTLWAREPALCPL